MSHSVGESPNATSDSVLHKTTAESSQGSLDYTAESSSFISHPDGSPPVEKWTPSAAPNSEPGDASFLELDDVAAHNASVETHSPPLSPEIMVASGQEDDSDVSKLANFSRLNLGTPETSSKHSQETELGHDFRNDVSDSKPKSFASGPSTARASPFVESVNDSRESLEVSLRSPALRSKRSSDFQNSSFLDDTRAQFDLDINIDDYQLNTRQRQGSPWRNFRSASPSQLPLRQTSLFSKRDFSEPSTAGVASTEKIEDLSKQLTNCKIQLKLYEKFLQDLIDSQCINVDEVTTFHSNLDHNIGSKSLSNTADYSFHEEVSPEKESLEMASLLEDLYASLEEYQSKWRDADTKVSVLNTSILGFARDVSLVLEKLGISTESIDDIRAKNSPEEYLDHVLQLLRNSSFNNESPKPQSRQSHESPRSTFTGRDHRSFSPSRLALQRSVNDPDFGSMTSTPRRPERPNSIAEDNVDNKLQEYQAMIDKLQREVNELKDQSRVGSVSDTSENTFYSHGSRDREKFLLLQKDYENLQGAHHDLIDEHHRYKNSSERTITSLKNQTDNLQKDKFALRSELAALASIQRDLEVSVEKQRILTTEKIKLSYQVEALNKDKISLHKNIEKLTDRLATASEKNAPSFEALRRKVSDASDLASQFYEVDVGEFEKLLKSFNKIADDSSLEDSRKKIDFMVPFKGTNLLEQQGNVLLSVKEAQKSVFHFFSRAVEVIVNDHIRLLLKDGEQKHNHEIYVEELKRHIKALEERTQQMSERPEVLPSPRSKLRIEELTNRWKAEREARILENRQAKKRLQELGQENNA